MTKEINVDEAQVRTEFDSSAFRSHYIACWIGILLNLLWIASDFVVFPEQITVFFSWRVVVSMAGLAFLLFHRSWGLSVYDSLFVLAAGISVQNAFMWSVMDEEHMKQHTFAYIALFIGVGMLLLWDFRYSVVLILLTVFSNLLFFFLFQVRLTFSQFLIDGALLVLTVAIFSIFLIRSRRRMAFSEIRSRLALQQSKELIQQEHAVVLSQKNEIENQRNQLEESNREITSSITYAKRIQAALMPDEKTFQQIFQESFVFFQPKDIVSGDFFWIAEKNDKVFYATADCTGHGVPGGFMTMLGLTFLDEIVSVKGEIDPGKILDLLRDRLVTTLKQTGEIGENKDGMDLVLCCIDRKKLKLSYAAANNSAFVVRGNELWEMKPDKQPCGFYHQSLPFTTRHFQLQPEDIVFTFTDGYPDQFGGPKGKKFKYQQLEKLMLSSAQISAREQKKIFSQTIHDWMGETHPQIDDMLLIGLRI
jgi:phosphoserine phosphatase RsbU/P